MTLNEEFIQLLSIEIKGNDNLLLLREHLMKYKSVGMDKDSMIKNLETLRESSDSKTEDTLLDLMDFVVGYCNPNLSIF